MIKKLSRRELARRMEQGREAMRVLAAAVVQAGGTLRVDRNIFDSLPVGHKMEVERERLTGDLLVRAQVPGDVGAVLKDLRELSFDEIRAKYSSPADPTRPKDGHPDSLTEPKPQGEGGQSSEP